MRITHLYILHNKLYIINFALRIRRLTFSFTRLQFVLQSNKFLLKDAGLSLNVNQCKISNYDPSSTGLIICVAFAAIKDLAKGVATAIGLLPQLI